MRFVMLLIGFLIENMLIAEQLPIQCHVWVFNQENLEIDKQISHVIDTEDRKFLIQEIGSIYKIEIRSNRDDFSFSLRTGQQLISTASMRTEMIFATIPGVPIFGTISAYHKYKQQNIRLVYSCSQEIRPPSGPDVSPRITKHD